MDGAVKDHPEYDTLWSARGADGGVDLVLRKGRERIFVQCKHYAVRRVDVVGHGQISSDEEWLEFGRFVRGEDRPAWLNVRRGQVGF